MDVTRSKTISAFKLLPPGSGITTLGLAWILNCPEHRVRGAIAWLSAGGLVRVAGRHTRRDRGGKCYSPRLWTWTGSEDICRVVRNRNERRADNEIPLQTLAAQWLSRKW